MRVNEWNSWKKEHAASDAAPSLSPSQPIQLAIASSLPSQRTTTPTPSRPSAPSDTRPHRVGTWRCRDKRLGTPSPVALPSPLCSIWESTSLSRSERLYTPTPFHRRPRKHPHRLQKSTSPVEAFGESDTTHVNPHPRTYVVFMWFA